MLGHVVHGQSSFWAFQLHRACALPTIRASAAATAAAALRRPTCCCCREVETLFHEFGHALQHMMTTVDEGLVAGIR
jgi:oligopeptidase A